MPSLIKSCYIALRHRIRGTAITKLPAAKRLHDLLLPHMKSREVTVHGHRMRLDPHDSLELSVRDFEPVETQLVLEHVPEGGTVLDVGANIGYYTLLFARAVGPKGKVFAFEPDPDTYALLCENIEANGYTNVEAINAAVSDKMGSLFMNREQSNWGDHRVRDTNVSGEDVEIPCVTLDEHFKDFEGRFDLVKMDIQGAEGRAIAGMRGLFAKRKCRKLITEYWPIGLKRFDADASEYLEELKAAGFEFQEIDEHAGTVRDVDLARVLANCTLENERFTNLFGQLRE